MKADTRVSWGQVLLALLPFVIAGIAKSLESQIINAPSVWVGAEKVDERALLMVKALPALLCIVPFVVYRRSQWPIWTFTWAGAGASGLLGFVRHTGQLLTRGVSPGNTETLTTIWGFIGPVSALLILGYALEKRCARKWAPYLPLFYLAVAGPLTVATSRTFSVYGRIPDAITWASSALHVALLCVVGYMVLLLVRQRPGRDWLPASLVMLTISGMWKDLWSPADTPINHTFKAAFFVFTIAAVAASLRSMNRAGRLGWLGGGLVAVWVLAAVAQRHGYHNWIAMGPPAPWMLYGFALNVFVPLLPALFDWNMRRRQAAALNNSSPLRGTDGM